MAGYVSDDYESIAKDISIVDLAMKTYDGDQGKQRNELEGWIVRAVDVVNEWVRTFTDGGQNDVLTLVQKTQQCVNTLSMLDVQSNHDRR